MRLATLIVVVSCATARADGAGDSTLNAGLSVAGLESVAVGGNVGGGSVGQARPTVVAKAYGDYRVAQDLHLGIAVPVGLNAPGPTSNEYDVGVALRVRLNLPGSLRSYVFAEPGLMYAKLPGGEWWSGAAVAGGIGARFAIASNLDFIAEAMVRLTSISGDVNYPSQFDPLLHGSVRVGYLGIALGIEAHL